VRILAYETFCTCYRQLPPQIQRKVDRQLRLLADNFRHPSLQTKKIQGTKGIFEARVDLHYRMSFEIEGDALVLRVVGNHDDVLKRP